MRIVNLLLLLFLLSACGPSATDSSSSEAGSSAQKQQQDSLWAQLMRVHDEVMPEMGTIHRLSSQIQSRMEEHDWSAEEREPWEKALKDLESAGDGMMTWMNQMKQLPKMRNDSLSHETIMENLSQDEASIQRVSEDMRTSIAQAQSLLESSSSE